MRSTEEERAEIFFTDRMGGAASRLQVNNNNRAEYIFSYTLPCKGTPAAMF